MKVNFALLSRVVIYALLVTSTAWWAYAYWPGDWWWKLAGSSFVSMILSIACGMINLGQLKSLK